MKTIVVIKNGKQTLFYEFLRKKNALAFIDDRLSRTNKIEIIENYIKSAGSVGSSFLNFKLKQLKGE